MAKRPKLVEIGVVPTVLASGLSGRWPFRLLAFLTAGQYVLWPFGLSTILIVVMSVCRMYFSNSLHRTAEQIVLFPLERYRLAVHTSGRSSLDLFQNHGGRVVSLQQTVVMQHPQPVLR